MASAVIFDMDGVLVNSEPYHLKVEKLIFEKTGIEITDKETGSFVGLAMDKMWEKIREKHRIEQSVKELVEEDTLFRVSYFRSLGTVPPIRGVAELASSILEAGLKTAVASSSHPDLIRVILESSGLSRFFPVRLSGFQVDNGKPEPDIFIRTAEILGIGCESCVVIEDSFNGVTAAKRAGMKCIGFRNPDSGNQDLSAADMVIESFSEIGPSLIIAM